MSKAKTNFITVESLKTLIEKHREETHPYKQYAFDSTSYTLLLRDVNNLIKENQQLKEVIDKIEKLVIEYLENNYTAYYENEIEVELINVILKILKEVSK